MAHALFATKGVRRRPINEDDREIERYLQSGWAIPGYSLEDFDDDDDGDEELDDDADV